MSKIDEMIARLCPGGVEYKKLTECADVLYGAPFDASFFNADKDGMPLIRIRDIKPGKTSTYYSGDFDDRYLIRAGDILIGMDGEFNTAKWKSDDALLNQRVLKIATSNGEIVDNNYLFHLLIPLMKDIEEGVTGSTVKHLSTRLIKSLEIPVPPLEVQYEIAQALDSFAELEAELEAELGARKVQYAYYRDELLSYESLKTMVGGEVELKKLGEACVRQRGTSITAAQMKKIATDEGDVIVFGGGQTRVRAMRESVNGAINEAPSVVVKSRGNIGFEYCDEAFTTKSELWSYRSDDPGIDIRFVYYVLEAHRSDFQEMAVSGKLPQISVGVTDGYEIPVPPLFVQQQVVDILDRFDALTTSLTDGLPAEIEARRQQYEHYRDRLLAFPRKEVA